MEKRIVNKYYIKSRQSIVIPNEEIFEMSREEGLQATLNFMFKNIEQHDIIVEDILVSPKIQKLFSAQLEKDTYASRHIWTAHVRVMDGLQNVIFIGTDGEELIFETRFKSE